MTTPDGPPEPMRVGRDEPHAEDASAVGSRGLVNAALLVWLAVQIALPVRGLVLDKVETRGRFSWNMYAHRYPCDAGYEYLRADGRRIPVNPADHLRLPDRVSMLFDRATLPRFHAYLCSEMESREGPGSLRGSVRCTLDREQPVVLLHPGQDPCVGPVSAAEAP